MGNVSRLRFLVLVTILVGNIPPYRPPGYPRRMISRSPYARVAELRVPRRLARNSTVKFATSTSGPR